jgi:hypothetical protein
MQEGYGTHSDYIKRVAEYAEARKAKIEEALRNAFYNFLSKIEVEAIVFSDISALELANAIFSYQMILKPLLAACNIAARAIERDLGIKNVDTYKPKLDSDIAKVLAGYIKPFLPACLEIPAIVQIDRISYIDKEIRKMKGHWEKRILSNLNKFSGYEFKKRTFQSDGEKFELDAAYPAQDEIMIGIDVKRIEARRDIHKRCDEIVNKAAKLKSQFRDCKFAAVIYYPFIEEHTNVQSRLRSVHIDAVVFASEVETSIANAVKMLIAIIGTRKNDR